MSDFGSQNPQQYASAGAAGRQDGPPPRPPMPGMAAHPATHPQQYPAPRPQAQQGPMPQGPGQFPAQPFPAQPFPAQQAPRQPIPAQRRPEQRPAQQQPAPAAWPSAPSAAPAWPAPAPAAPVDDDPNSVPVRKKGKAGKVIGLLVVAAALGGVAWVVATGPQAPVTAAIGECVTQTGADDIAIVGCGDPSAQFKVAGKVENKTVIDASLFACSDFPDATSSYWQGVEGKPGTVLCLAPMKPAAPANP
jgi:hypothetical protein